MVNEKKSGNQKKVLVIVESPAKARTIEKYLGAGYVVDSSIGHIRDLPSTASEIPADIKSESWARLGVNVEEDFKPIYVIPNKKKAQVKKLRGLLKNADALYLATDEDREGEAIAWHLVEVLQPKCPVRRMVFDEITKTAIQSAVENTRDIDVQLVNAQETRRILDRLVGYEVSPVLWRKVRPKLSAGRVQSVATRLVVEREQARMRFRQGQYWDIEAKLELRDPASGELDTKLVELGGKRLASGKDFEETTGQLKSGADVVLLGDSDARQLADHLESAEFTVTQVSEKPFTNKPYPPFITSTLQQEAGRKLRFSAQRTMRLAQALYENGYITYMRTDSTNLSQQAISAARSQVADTYGGEYLPDQPRVYRSKSKNAQEAHEAIRPAGESFRTPDSVKGELGDDERKLYDLIWKRTVASQMRDARGMRTSVRIEADAGERGSAVFTTSGKVIQFAGFLRAYVEGADDPAAELESQEKVLPPAAEGQKLDAKELKPAQHFTQPPARYTEASLIKELEDRGIGRPSTYATIIQTIQDRGYVWHKGSALVPSFTAFAVTNLLVQHLSDLVDYDFTARMEDGLDTIASGENEPVPWLKGFYYGQGNGAPNGNGHHITNGGLKEAVHAGSETIDPRAVSSIPIGQTAQGEQIVVRVGRYGPYIQLDDTDQRASVPDDLPPDELTVEKAMELIEQANQSDRVLGHDPDTGKPIYIKTGRFGPYVQLGDPEYTEKGTIKRGSKAKKASLWPGMTMESVSLEEALMLLSFPREVGKHPDTGEMITAQEGRFGPYLKMGDDSRSLDQHEKLATITLDEAVEIFKQPKGRRGRARQSAVLAELGQHPQHPDCQVQVKSGRYGPYVTDGVVNATIPKGKDPATVTLEEGLQLLAAREQKIRDQGKDPRAKKTKKKAAKRSTRKTAKKAKKAKKSAS